MALSAHTARLAVEALRNGVPNREAVRELGCSQPRAEARFVEMLDRAADAGNPPANAQGMLVSGDFGTGKSHLLTHLEYLALSRNFVCSKVTVSKETPFYDLGKVFAPAVESGRLPDGSGQLVEELALAMEPASEGYEDFFRRIEDIASKGVLSPIFPASLRAHECASDLEVRNDIESFWAGDRILVKRIRDELRRTGEVGRYRFRAPKIAELPPQRLRFAVELIKGAGYAGWVVLLDEIELIGSYSILQRGRSYAEIARWLGFAPDEAFPGLVVVGAVTDDFAAAVIQGKRIGKSSGRNWRGARDIAGSRRARRPACAVWSMTAWRSNARATPRWRRRWKRYAVCMRGRTIGILRPPQRSPTAPVSGDGCVTRSAPPSTNGICTGCAPAPGPERRSRTSSPATTKTPTWSGKRRTTGSSRPSGYKVGAFGPAVRRPIRERPAKLRRSRGATSIAVTRIAAAPRLVAGAAGA